jgi:hypothetical protein
MKVIRIGFRRRRPVKFPDGSACEVDGGVIRWSPRSPAELELRAAALAWAEQIAPCQWSEHQDLERLLIAARAVAAQETRDSK